MKKIFLLPVIALAFSAGATSSASTVDSNPLSGIINGLKGDSDSDDNPLGALGGIVSGLLSTDEIKPASLAGTWEYTGPAVCFKSENFLQKAGGSAMASTIESTLAPYYKRFGLTKLTLTVDEEMNFTMQSGKMKATGTVIIEGKDVYFNFAVLGKISLGKIKTYITQSGSQMSVMFDVTKLMNVVKAVSSVSGSASISAVTSLLDSYEGICAGFKLKKQ